jgi:hypothetical protein
MQVAESAQEIDSYPSQRFSAETKKFLLVATRRLYTPKTDSDLRNETESI